jgi:uncharacterized protein (DUF1697 family)
MFLPFFLRTHFAIFVFLNHPVTGEAMIKQAKPAAAKQTRYVAFLRGINVSGQKIIRMTDLAKMFSDMGFDNVRTYIQSGNVIFESREKDEVKLRSKIEKGLNKALGYAVPVVIRSSAELAEIAGKNLFAKTPAESKPYITFLAENPEKNMKDLPLLSPKKDVQVIGVHRLNVFCLSLCVKGSFGFPNAFLEKELGVFATTRNLNTLMKLLE